MIKIRRSTKTVIVFEDLSEIHSHETDVDVMAVLPKWVCKAGAKALRAAFLLKKELEVWKSSQYSLYDKVFHGFHMVAA